MEAPRAAVRPHPLTHHGHTRTDPYYWLRERDNPEVIEYLTRENEYTAAQMEDTKTLQESLFEELKSRIKEDDMSVPVQIDDFFYYTRTETGKQYAYFCRRKGSMEAPEEVLLDQNSLAQGMAHCALGVFEVSPDHRLLAYSIDEDGSEFYTLRVKNLETGELLDDVLTHTSYSLAWMNDSQAFVYARLDENRRPYMALMHVLGTLQSEDRELLVEMDERFFLGVDKSKDDRLVFITLNSKETDDTYLLDADAREGGVRHVTKRRQGHEYSVEHHGGSLYIRTNKDAKNYRLMRTPLDATEEEHWEEVIAHRDEIMLEGFELFASHMVLYERVEGMTKLRVRTMSGERDDYIEIPEAVYAAGGAGNPVFSTDRFRFSYSSLVTPYSVFEYHMDTKEHTLLKREEVLGGYDPEAYEVRREYATASDGVQIPISIAHRKGLSQDGSNPCWLYGYGSYGTVIRPGFNENRISLLDRGFVFAIAHVRGGGEKGKRWYEDGKYLKKRTTFTDFIACAEHLVAEGYTNPSRMVAVGRSAGGLLMGAIANMRPDLFAAIVADVPFVDALTTMLDPGIPLTVTEYEEWGNPETKEYYDYMLSYSPYDNVEAKQYPHLLVQAGLNDPRVQYWEPAKWVAKLRATKTDSNLLLFKTEMEHGHGGATGRYDALKEVAFEFAFVLKVLDRA